MATADSCREGRERRVGGGREEEWKGEEDKETRGGLGRCSSLLASIHKKARES